MKKLACSLALGALLTGCSAARFTMNKAEDIGAPTGAVPATEAASVPTPGTNGQQYDFDCQRITPESQPAEHSIPLNRLGQNGDRVVLQFDNRAVTARLLEAANKNKSLSFTSWDLRRRVSVFTDVVKTNWVRVQPTHPEIICFIDHVNATAIPRSTAMPMVRTYYHQPDSRFVKADFSNANHASASQVGQFNLSCFKNRTEGRNTNAQLTLAEVNRVLCGVASVHLAP